MILRILVIFSLFITSSYAAFVKLNVLDRNFTQGVSGSAYEFGIGWYSFGEKEQYTIGTSFTLASVLTKSKKSAYTLAKDAMEALKSDDEAGSDNSKFKKLIFDLERTNIFSGAFLTMNYNVLGKRGLYVTGGLGYGAQVSVKEGVGNLADFYDQVSKIDKAVDKDKTIDDLVNSDEFKHAMETLANDPSTLVDLLGQLFPNSSALISQVDSREKIEALIADKGKLEVFLQDTETAFSKPVSISGKDLICKSFVSCKYGVAYQIGVGYDYQIYKALGADFYTKMYGLFGNEPIYALGVNVSLAW